MAEFFLITLRINVIHFALKTSEVKYNCETADNQYKLLQLDT